MKNVIFAAVAALTLIGAQSAFAKCVNIGGKPGMEYYCQALQPSICTPDLTSGNCASIAQCTNIGGKPGMEYYCQALQPSICTPELTSGNCAMF